MAAPHVAGALALLKAQFPNDSYLQLINRVFSTVDPLTSLSNKCVTGGRLNLHKALTSTSSRPRNDNFGMSYAIVVPNGQTAITARGNNVDATIESGEPLHGGGSGGVRFVALAFARERGDGGDQDARQHVQYASGGL